MKYVALFILSLLWLQCAPVQHITGIEEHNVDINNLSPDVEIQQIIEPYKAMLDEEMNTVLGTCTKTLSKNKPESTLGNWFCDLLAEASDRIYSEEVAFVVQNYGGLRIPEIPAGPVTKRTIFELMPFDNLLVLIEMSGEELMRFIKQMAASGGWPQSSSLRYEIVNEAPEQITIDGAPMDMTRSYWVGMPDYIANGGDGTYYLSDNPRRDQGIFLRDAAIEQVMLDTQAGKAIEAERDGRIISKD